MSGPLYSSTENTFINKKHKRAARKLRSSKYLQIHYLPFVCLAFVFNVELPTCMYRCPWTCEKQACEKSHTYVNMRKRRNRHYKGFRPWSAQNTFVSPSSFPHIFPIHDPWPPTPPLLYSPFFSELFHRLSFKGSNQNYINDTLPWKFSSIN